MGKSRENKPKLLDDSSSDSEVNFTINHSYANAYDKFRQGEELQRLKDKYGSDPDTSSSSDSEEELPPVIEKDFLKTLSLLKSKDPQIYDEKCQFFKENPITEKKKKEKKPKPLYPKDYERKMLLERNGELSDSDEEREKLKKLQPTYDEEQEEIRRSFKAALENSDAGSGDDDGEGSEGLFRVRQKDKKKIEEEEEDYIQWLKGKKDDVDGKKDSELSFLHDYWNDPGLDEDEKFLKDYILNKKYLDEDDDDDEIPTYEEITGGIDTLSDDEKHLEKQQIFEHKYNFRFEEPDEEFIKKYPRSIDESLRKKDNKRKQKREEYNERKKREKEQKKEEIRQLKALKRKEIEEKLEKLKETVGNEQLAFNDLDVEGEFDPLEHDKKMQKLFDDNFYDMEESEKPEFPSDDEMDPENWDKWTREGASCHMDDGYQESTNHYDAPHCEDPDFIMDADYDPKISFQQQMIESSKKKSKRHRKKSKFAEVVEKSKPVFDQYSETYQKYIDEYYKLDCEDIIGDLPVRFKYHNVVPNDFGLSTEEIWASEDRELNQWCSLKKISQYRKEEEELYDVQAYKKKASDIAKKRKIFVKYFEQLERKKPDENTQVAPSTETVATKKKKRRKKRKIADIKNEQNSVKSDDEEQSSPNEKNSGDVGVTPTGELLLSKNQETAVPSTSVGAKETLVENSKHKKKKQKKSESVAVQLDSSISREHSDAEVNLQRDDVIISEKPPVNSVSFNVKNTKKSTKKQKRKQGKNIRGNKETEIDSKTFNRKGTKGEDCADKRLLIPDSRLKAYGINPKKFRNRFKFSKKP